MKPSELDKKIWSQDSIFLDYVKYWNWKIPSDSDQARSIRKFMKRDLSIFLEDWQSFYFGLQDNYWTSKQESFWTSKFNDLKNKAVQISFIPSTQMVGAEMSLDDNPEYQNLQKFHSLCGVSIIVDENGKNPVLCASLNYKGTDFKRCIALQPVIEMLADKVKEYHDRLHSSTTEVSGRGRRRSHRGRHRGGRNRGDGDDSGQDSPPDNTPDDAMPPEGGTLDDMRASAQTAQSASTGIAPPGYDLSREETLRRLGIGYLDAPQNLPPLEDGQDPLQIGAWYDSIVSAAKNIGESKAIKTLYTDLKKAATNRQVQTLALSAAMGPEAGAALNIAYAVHDNLTAAQDGDPRAIDKLTRLAMAAQDGHPEAQQALEMARNMNQMLKAKANGEPVQTAGWLYNKPYRSNAEVVVDGLSGKFPTVGLFLREGWHDGLDFAKNMKRKSIFELGA